MSDVFTLMIMGSVAGVLAGLLGIGGGIVIVPALAIVLEHHQVNHTVLMHLAIGTSMATIVVTSLSSIRTHQRHSAVLWPVFWKIVPGIVIGGFLGTYFASLIPGDFLQVVFGVFLLLVAAQMILGATPEPHRQLPETAGLTVTGLLIGSLSTLLGVGGGTMSVPFLVWCNIKIQNAVATSAAIGFPIALSGVTGYIISGWNVAGLPAMSFGFVSVPAFLSIAIASILFAPLGAIFTHRISAKKLKAVFGFFLILLSIKMLY